jgi:hypothetical protein
MQLAGCPWWHPSSKSRHNDIFVNVLPRAASDAALAEILSRTHNKFHLWGGTVSVSAPKCAALARCTSCGEQGHAERRCLRFSGKALRLLFNSPISPASLEQLRVMLRARSAFFGSGDRTNAGMPHRKVTLMFDIDENDSAQVAKFARLIEEMMSNIRGLHEAPSIVDVSRRHMECRECGFLPAQRGASHTCP